MKQQSLRSTSAQKQFLFMLIFIHHCFNINHDLKKGIQFADIEDP